MPKSRYQMKKKQRGVQFILVSIGLFLIIATYFYYPSIKKDKLLKDQSVNKDFQKVENIDQSTSFENLEYKGLYNFDKPFKVKSEKAYILNENPDLVYMNSMHVTLNLSDGRIINITSTAGENARVNSAAYSASKAGLIQFTRTLAMELGPDGITVNAVGPGLTLHESPIWTPPSKAYQKAFIEQTPMGRAGTPQDVAQAVTFLASEQATYITGQAIFVDGGYSSGKLSVRD